MKANEIVNYVIETKKDIKVKVNPLTSRLLQEACFEAGIAWGEGETHVQQVDKPYLGIGTTLSTTRPRIGFYRHEESFLSSSDLELTIDLFTEKATAIAIKTINEANICEN